MNKFFKSMLCVATVIVVAWAPLLNADAPKVKQRPQIEIAILLDTSGSMSGLIEQAKSQLWKIVNEFATAKKNGQAPELKVALYEYGKSSIPSSEGFIRMLIPLTTDLDKVSEQLFALRTNGGEEYCGQVIQRAITELAWSKSNENLKAIFIAGNEPFTQGHVDYRQSCKNAITKGIVVNTIHCGPYQQGVNTGWENGAILADGNYMNIDHNRKVVHIAAPQDKKISQLGVELNKTYISYGRLGHAGKRRQMAQDANAQSVSAGSSVQRMISKSTGNYRNSSWDLVDAVKEKKVSIADVKEKDLPEEMRKMNIEQRKAYIKAKTEQRRKLQVQIKKLTLERKKYVAEKRKKMAEEGVDTLDAVITKTLRKQAKKKNFKIE